MKTPIVPIHHLWLAGISIATVAASDVRSWRNDGNGLYPAAQVATDWSGASRVKWETPLPARGNGSTILVGGKLFLTAEPATLMAVDAATGKILWEKPNEYTDLMEMAPGKSDEMKAAVAKAKEIEEKAAPLERELYREERRMRRNQDDATLRARVEELKKQIGELRKEGGPQAEQMKKPNAHDTNGYSSYTPVSDGKHVWACFGTGVVVCYDLDGKRVWHKRTDTPDHDWGGASSPTLVDGKLIIRFTDHVAFDPATGKELWRTPSTGVAFNCPSNFKLDGKAYIFTARGELIRASDGKKLPSENLKGIAKPFCFFNTPSVIGNRIYTAHGSEGEQGEANAYEIPTTAELLEKDGLKKLWHTEISKNRYYSSPLVHEGLVYLISREYQMQALDAASGEIAYSEKIKGFTGTAYPSLTLVGSVIFVGAEDGSAAFVKPGRTFQEISRTKVDPYRSTPIFDGELCYLRTQEKLRAIRAK
ncbi:MAG: PQQ-binding-like beta-propeller repeat protein [Verrucomicrobiota bacterium]